MLDATDATPSASPSSPPSSWEVPFPGLGVLKESHDVIDAVLRARRLSRRAGLSKSIADAQLPDALLLAGLLDQVRAFSPLWSIFRALRVSASTWRQAHRQGLKQAGKLSPSAENALSRAHQAAQAQQAKQVDGAHLLLALSQSDDPVVRAGIHAWSITPERISQAAATLQRGAFGRQVLYTLRETAEVVVVVLFFLIVIKEGLGELRLIPSESMLPLLEVNDRVLIEKVTRWWRPYHRGDILVFYPPMTRLPQDPWSVFLRLTGFSNHLYRKEDQIDVAYIKRLIGMPGDQVEVRPGIGVFVNGRKLDEPYVREQATSCTVVQPMPTCGPITVPPNSFFMMGDNRNQSLDSRFWGVEPKSRVIGRAMFRIWPLNRLGGLEVEPGMLEHPTDARLRDRVD